MFISDDQEVAASLRERWQRQVPGVPLVIVESPYRALAGPLMAYLDVLDRAWPPDKPAPITFVVLPEYVARSWWERILYNQSARRLRSVLLGRPHTVIVGRALSPRRAGQVHERRARRGRRDGGGAEDARPMPRRRRTRHRTWPRRSGDGQAQPG